MAESPSRETLRRLAPAFWLWLSLFLPAATVYHPNAGWNVNSRLDLVFALVDQGSAGIDDYQDLPPYDTGDKALFNGHFYSDKVFGLSVLGVIPYAVLKAAFAIVGKEPGYAVSAWWIRVCAVGALAAGAGVLLWRFLRRLGVGPRAAFWLTQSLFYGSLLFPYTTVFYPYLPGVFFCLLAWDRLESGPALWDRSDRTGQLTKFALRPGGLVGAFLVGLYLGGAIILDFIFGLVVAALAMRALWSWRGRGWARKTVAAALGGATPLGAFALYTVSLFGSFSIPYRFEADPLFRIGMSRGFMGITGFQPAVLYYLTIHPYRGLFFWSPILALAVVGAVRMMAGSARGNTSLPPAAGGDSPAAASLPIHPSVRSDQSDQSDPAHQADTPTRLGSRLAGGVALGLGTAYLLFNSSYYMWWGGWAMGPRLLIPAIPFLALGAAGVWRWGRWGRALAVAAGILSVALILPPALVDPQTPMWLHKWPDLLHPTKGQNLAVEQFIQMRLFSQGRIDVTLGGLLGLPGFAALIPTVLLWIVPAVLFSRTCRSSVPIGPTGGPEET